jgi:hypothetical protein
MCYVFLLWYYVGSFLESIYMKHEFCIVEYRMTPRDQSQDPS